MNVLLITFSFPPAAGVGVLRALSLAKYLPAEDVRVDVLTARNAPAVGRDVGLLHQVPAAVAVHRTWTLDLPFGLRKALKRLLGKNPERQASTAARSPASLSGSAPASPGNANSQAKGNPLRRLIGNLLLPDPQIGWLPFAVPAALRIIRRRGIDVVIVTVPPFSSAAIVTRLRRSFPALPIVLDFRDEWLTTTLHLVSFNNNERARAIALKTEADAVQSATAVVLVTEAARHEIIARYPQQSPGKFVCIHNGFDREPLAPAPSTSSPDSHPIDPEASPGLANLPLSRNRPVTFTYLGTVYGSTDPSTLAAAVQSLPPELRARLRLRFIGHIEQPRYREMLTALGSTVELQGFVPQAEALSAMDSTDWLLLVTHDRVNVAAKFYDYVAGGKPIFAAVHPDGDVRKLLEQTGMGVWADVRDSAAICALLEQALTGTVGGHSLRPRPAEIARFHRRALTRQYADLLRSLVRAQPGECLEPRAAQTSATALAEGLEAQHHSRNAPGKDRQNGRPCVTASSQVGSESAR